MSIETWLAYAAAYATLSLLPGPSVLMVIGQSLSRGGRAAFACILGDLLGGVVVMTVAFAGAGAVLAASSAAFLAIKWAGAAYMAYLGLSQLRAARRMSLRDLQREAPGGREAAAMRAGSLRAGFLTGVLNPKAILFYVAFLAPFLDPAQPMAPQFLLLMATSSAIVALVLGGYAILATRARLVFGSLRARKRMGYAGGGCLLGGAALMASR